MGYLNSSEGWARFCVKLSADLSAKTEIRMVLSKNQGSLHSSDIIIPFNFNVGYNMMISLILPFLIFIVKKKDAIFVPNFYWYHVPLLFFATLLKKKVVIRICGAELTLGKLKPIKFYILRRAYQVIILNSTQRQILVNNEVRNFSLIPNYVPSILSKYIKTDFSFREGLALIHVANVVPEKGLLEFLNSLDKDASKLISSINIYGKYDPESNYVKSVLSQASKKEIELNLFGVVEPKKVFERMMNSDVMIHYSHREGMPNALIEAMGVGLPVIASDIPGVNSIIVNGVNGFLVCLSKSKQIPDLIKRLHASEVLREIIGVEARATIVGSYNKELALSRYLKVLCP